VDGEKFRKVKASGTFDTTNDNGCKQISATGIIALPNGDVNVSFDFEKCRHFKYTGTFEVTGGTGDYADATGSGDAKLIAGKKHFGGKLTGELTLSSSVE